MTYTYLYPPVDDNPDDIKQAFNNYMAANIANWKANSGNLDDWIASGFAQEIADLKALSSDAATAIYRYFGANIAGVPPVDAGAAQGLVTITATDTAGYTIPANTQLLFVDGTGALYSFQTVNSATITAGSTSVAGVAVQATQPGSISNGLTGSAQLVTPLNYIASITLAQATSGGTDAESDDTYLTRLTQEFTTLTPKPILPIDFSVVAVVGVTPPAGRAVTLGGFNPTGTASITGTTTSGSNQVTVLSSTTAIGQGTAITGAGIPAATTVLSVVGTTATISANATASASGVALTLTGTYNNGGTLTTFVTDINGVALSGGAMSTMQSQLTAMLLTGVSIAVNAPTYTTINVVATVFAWPGQDGPTIQAAVQSAIASYLSPASWGVPPTNQSPTTWFNDTVVRLATVEHAILGVPGVHYVSAITLNAVAVDVTMQGAVALPTLGTNTVTVNIG